MRLAAVFAVPPRSFILIGLLIGLAVTPGCDGASEPAGTPAGTMDVSDVADPEDGEVPRAIAFPALVAMEPRAGATDVPRTAWLRLTFASDPALEALAGLHLDCGAGTPTITAESIGKGRVVVNPAGELPAGRTCTLAWQGPAAAETTSFSVAAAGDPAIVPYDREDPSRLSPFPDDAFLVPDAATPTGRRLRVPTLDRPDNVVVLLGALTAVLPEDLDGFSALAPIVFDVADPLDPASLPLTEAASLDPLASVGLFDLDPASPTYLQRLAFDLVMKDEPNADATPAHVILVFPIAPLAPRGQYAFVVTRQAQVDPTRPLSPSPYTRRVLADPATPSGAAAQALAHARPALLDDDLALVLRISVRSLDHTGDDLVAIRQAVFAMPAPSYTITRVTPRPTGAVAAIVEGTWQAPDWRDGDFLARDELGRPRQVGMREIPFVLALPDGARMTPAPIVMYQHGNPGSAEVEVPSSARRSLAAAGFAVAGFTDIINRELAQNSDDVTAYVTAVVQDILADHRVPDFVALLDTADQLSFIRLLERLGDLDVLPVDLPDGAPDLDPLAPLAYLGVSYGSFHGVGLLPFAPEIHSAALVVGGGRFSCTVVKQETDGPRPNHLYDVVTSIFRDVSRVELWIGVALAQTAADDQDWLTHASHLYRDTYPLGDSARASVLVAEGLGDNYVPTYSTRAAATAMGLAQLDPSPDPVPTLVQAGAGPLSANIDQGTTGGFLQYVPEGLAGYVQSPACNHEPEGHYCAQAGARPVMVRFFSSALLGVPTISP